MLHSYIHLGVSEDKHHAGVKALYPIEVQKNVRAQVNTCIASRRKGKECSKLKKRIEHTINLTMKFTMYLILIMLERMDKRRRGNDRVALSVSHRGAQGVIFYCIGGQALPLGLARLTLHWIGGTSVARPPSSPHRWLDTGSGLSGRAR